MPTPRRLTRRDLLWLLVVVLAGLGIGQWLQSTAPLGRDVGTKPAAIAALADTISPSRTTGTPTLTVVVFTDYQCPACRIADPALDDAIARDGHIKLVYRDWPIFGPLSERAARVAIAANRQGIYPKLHHLLMEASLPLDEPTLRTAVASAGGDWTRIERDLVQYDADINQQLERTRNDAFALGLPGTPGYLIGPLLVVGAQTQASFSKAFAEARSARR